ncbi:MAG: dephospho-CoA kinase [Gammaproteobacteria bacterium]
MLIIGLTGGIGSGKSIVSEQFKKLGAGIIDTDQIAKELVTKGKPALAEIAKHFGREILDEQGHLNRMLLRDKIFNNLEEKQWLENLLHPMINEEIANQLKETKAPYCIIVIPLLFETNYSDFIQRVLVVDSPEQLQIERASKRDQSSEANIKKIICHQISRTERLARADDVIINDSTLDNLEKQVTALHEKYMKLC